MKKPTRKPPSGLRSKKSTAGAELLELCKLGSSDLKAELSNCQERQKDF